jgi:alpha-beta hydrolase superfamily lysophospholipase
MSLRLLSKTYWRGSWIKFREPVDDFAVCKQATVYVHDGTQVRGLYWTPKNNPRPRVAVIAAHQRVDFSQHYAFPALLRAGYGCLGANLRTLGNDMSCIHEQIILDVAAYVRWLKEERSVEKVVWLGNSGGGSLGGFYQAQAKAGAEQRLMFAPGGRPTGLRDAVMPAFDAMMVIAAHAGQGLIMNEVIDPSVVDESDPLLTDSSLDMYDPTNGFVPAPGWSRYDPAFVTRYRAAQIARVVRIDAHAKALIAAQMDAEATLSEPSFELLPAARQRTISQRASFQSVITTYRTMANLNYVDATLDPSKRGYGSLLSERPDLMNFQVAGFGRVQTPDAWLSTWSGLSSNANLLKNGPAITEPVVVVNAGRDMDVYPETHSKAIFNALGSKDKTYLDFPDRLHYFEPEEGEADNSGALEQMAHLVPWLQSRVPL